MKSTPTNIILAESGEFPLEIRRHLLCTKFSLFGFDLAIQFSNQVTKSGMLPCYIADYDSQLFQFKYEDSKIIESDKHSQHIFDDLINQKHRGKDIIYTDASVDPQTVTVEIGIHSADLNINISHRVSNKINICTAEIIAMRMAINVGKKLSNNLLIALDSMSGLQKLKRTGIQVRNDYNTLLTGN